MKTALITGSSGLVGAECVSHFDAHGWRVIGIDNNLRRDFFGPAGDTSGSLARLLQSTRHFEHLDSDIRQRDQVMDLLHRRRPELIVHCAAQPSHDLAGRRPLDDFEVNAGGTLNLLEGARRHCPEAVFCFLSTNKVYGDAPNELRLVEKETRFDFAQPEHRDGIDETMRIDQTTHSLFGVSKAAADLLVQEYGRYFGMKTVCFRGGCLTGARHAAVELHGFLAYLMKCVRAGQPYRIYGYQGKQVRDILHAVDVCGAIACFYEAPRCGAVYNLGGGRNNSISVREAIARAQETVGKKLDYTYESQHRLGDHKCYITNLAKFRSHYPTWRVTMTLDQIFADLA